MLNIVWGHNPQLRYHSPLFHKFQQYNVKAAVAHHTIIQKEVDELLAKGAIEPSFGGVGFFSSVFVVPKHTYGLQPILNIKCFKRYLHIPSFKMLTIRCVAAYSAWYYAFSIDYRMLISIFLSLSIIISSNDLLGTICLISGRFYHLGWPQPLRFSLPSLNLFCSIAITRFSVLFSIWMTSWSWFTLSR